MQTETATTKVPRGRSPSYPGIDLAVAIQRAERLYEVQRDHAGSADVILGHWGYGTKSGAGLVALAALKKFGLIQDSGKGRQRKAMLTPLALRIVRDKRQDSPERVEAIKRAALTPPIHREVWDRYHGNLPKDSDLVAYLALERGFTDHGAKEFVDQFRKTITFANLQSSDTLPDNYGNTEENQGDDGGSGGAGQGMTPTDPSLQTVQIPLPTKPWAVLQVPEAMTEEAWDHMLRFFEFIKPSVVKKEDAEG